MPEKKILLPEVMVIAGPNGSGKTTITKLAKTVGLYINADDIKRSCFCSDLEAAQKAELLREEAILKKTDFTFETVLSTDRNLKLLQKAKYNGYFIWSNEFWNFEDIKQLTGIENYDNNNYR